METKRAAGVRLVVSFAAGLLLYAGAMPGPPADAREADASGADVWTDAARDKLGPSVRQTPAPAQDGPGAAALRPDGGRAHVRQTDSGSPVKPDEPKIVDLRLGLLAPLKFATNYVDGSSAGQYSS
ncbi:Uncharacterized protein TXXE_11675 [Thermobacillus xylanilyticus]|jgi:hypothetical protein|uniref:Uncharacterized protein n=1 Tax=Thermobacillus xylanilyticus TaxID=76633 RepID=A0ABN7S205_THEXY|nr:hypothetical protein [Thermobacillus xylanilyticus]CAG5088236.1 Uncharacterized protein TXXE_11675 [Thermobacillus xylanilyticus]